MRRGPWYEEADLIVVGGSAGGLVGAITAGDRRCRTIVLERAKELGGGAATDAELIAAAGTRHQREAGIADDVARFAADVEAAARHHVEPEMAAALAEQSAPLVAWLADRCGTPLRLLPSHQPTGHSAPRLHAPGDRGGASLIADLARAATHHPRITVRTGAPVEHLIRDDAGAVRGVAVRGDRRGTTHSIGGAVLLACGGYAGNDALVAEHCAAVAELPYGGAGKADGEGLRLGLQIGVATRRLAGCRVTPLLAMPGGLVVAAPVVELGGVLVNQAGHRFTDESAERLAVATAVRCQPGRVAYLLFDERIAAAAREMDPFFAHVVLPRAGRKGASLEHLAKQFELNAEGLTLTVDTYNGNLDIGGDPFGRERSGSPLEPPFHAIRVSGGRLHTTGGIAVDRAARVLDAEGKPIPGLYATAGTAAGLGGEGTEGTLAGTEALAALGLARLAALDLATTQNTTPPEEP